jgi:protein-disulfide isomerase
MKKKTIIVSVAVLAIASIFYVYKTNILTQNQKTAIKKEEVITTAEEIASENIETSATNSMINSFQPEELDVVFGNESAPITIIEYASFGCSHCADFAKSVFPDVEDKLIKTSKANFVLRSFPLDAPSLMASVLVNCVPKSDYYKFAKTLFQTNQKWAYTKKYKEELLNIFRASGYDAQKFDECTNDKKLEESILKVRLNGSKKYKIASTPSFIINSKNYGSIKGIEGFENIIKSELDLTK